MRIRSMEEKSSCERVLSKIIFESTNINTQVKRNPISFHGYQWNAIWILLASRESNMNSEAIKVI